MEVRSKSHKERSWSPRAEQVHSVAIMRHGEGFDYELHLNFALMTAFRTSHKMMCKKA